jgi:hypothetical protein
LIVLRVIVLPNIALKPTAFYFAPKLKVVATSAKYELILFLLKCRWIKNTERSESVR